MPVRKLTSEESKELYRDFTVGRMTYRQLTELYGICRKTVWRELDRNRNPEKYRGGRWANGNLKRLKRLKPCGTEAAYRRHHRKNEMPCIPCCDAHHAYNQKWKSKQRKAA